MGVLIDDCFNQHVDYLIKICSQNFDLLQQMKKQGLSNKCIAIVLSKLRKTTPNNFLLLYILQIFTNLKNFCTVAIRTKFSTKRRQICPPHLNCTATLPCEIWMFKIVTDLVWYSFHLFLNILLLLLLYFDFRTVISYIQIVVISQLHVRKN